MIKKNCQVSYLIVDQADNDLEMANDPFLEAGISIPDELPYQYEESNSVDSVIKEEHTVSVVCLDTSSKFDPESCNTDVEPPSKNGNLVDRPS